MAASPSLKIFSPTGEYVASCKYGEDAAALVSIYGDGAEVRSGHAKKDRIWLEGSEEFSAGDSYDGASRIMRERVSAKWEAWQAKQEVEREAFKRKIQQQAAGASITIGSEDEPEDHRDRALDSQGYSF